MTVICTQILIRHHHDLCILHDVISYVSLNDDKRRSTVIVRVMRGICEFYCPYRYFESLELKVFENYRNACK